MANKIKKIAVFHNLPGGGGMRMLEKITERYKNLYHIEIYVISDRETKDIPGVKIHHIKVSPWKGFFLRSLWTYLVLPVIHKRVASEINNKFDLAFLTHDYFTKSPFILRFLKIKKLYLCQEPQREFYEKWSIHASTIQEKIVNVLRFPIKIIDEKNVSYSDLVLCNSKYSRSVIRKVYQKNSKIIYPGVDTDYFKPNKTKDKKTILCIGGINPVKDQYFLLDSIGMLTHKYNLVLIGSGKSDYIEKILSLSLHRDSIKILNKVTDDELRRHYAKAIVTCITANLEPFGLSSIESQSCGTPVVSVNEGGVVETIINGVTGYVSERDKSSYLEKVRLAIKNHKSLGKKARLAAVKNWNWNRTLSPLDKIMEL